MNNEIFSIEKLKEMANPIIQIPNFDNTGTINVRVQRPQLMAMASKGQIPNHLLSIATSMISGEQVKGVDKMDDEGKVKAISDTMDLYCMACLIEPSYEDFKDILTDEQKGTIFSWGIGQVSSLDSFRKDKADGLHNNDGQKVPKKTK